MTTCAYCGNDTDAIYRVCGLCLAKQAAEAPPLTDDTIAVLAANGLARYLPRKTTDAAA